MTSNVSRGSVKLAEAGGRLNATGTNFLGVLAGILKNGVLRQSVNAALGEVLPGSPVIRLEDSSDGQRVTIKFELWSDHIELRDLSDGTIHWLHLLVILLNADSPPLIVLDEPELGLHPDCLAALGNLICDVAERGASQIVIATHSPALLDVFEARGFAAGLRVFDFEDDGVKITQSSQEQLDIWCDEDTTLGDAWIRGAFGGVRW